MKKKKSSIFLLIILLIISAILLGNMMSYAKDADTPLIVSLSETDEGIGYSIFNPAPGQDGKYIWNIITSNAEKRNLYCVKAEYGTTWEDEGKPTEQVTYDFQYDLQSANDINELKSFSDEVVSSLLATGETGIYEELIWLFDNFYIPEKTDKDAYLENIGVLKNEQGYYYIGEDGYEHEYEAILTDEDIIAIQKVAIWKFTNGGIYSLSQEEKQWLRILTDDGYKILATAITGDAGAHRNIQANLLYNYLVTSAAANVNTEKNIITVDTTGLEKEGTETEGYNYILQTKIINGKYVTGPIKITKANEAPYKIGISVTANNQDVKFDYTDANGNIIENATIQNVVGRAEGFYISTNINSIDELKIAISVEDTTKTLWLAGNEDETTGTITLTGQQPIVEIERNKEIINFIVDPFDLALRKYITAVNGKNVVNNRVLNNIDLTRLEDGTETTAEYKHRKDPVEVKDGDIVTYTLAIYNEGSKDGYATKIIDQLPTGLIWNNESETIVTSSKGNTYKLEWDQISLTRLNPLNQITLTMQDKNEAITSYTVGGELDYETIEIECIVATSELSSEKEITLTNVAWIAEACDSEGKTAIDRDSQPETVPSVDKDNMQDYRGTTTEQESALANNEFYFKGQQDDDDFEKLIVKKNFDLALVKFIAAISDDETIEEDEYLKDANGRYSREPDVKIDSETGEIVYDFSERGDKNPLRVEPGDYVLYTIRVYNEGEINGYASEIKDILPKGLEYVLCDFNAEYKWQWKKNVEDGTETITTNWYAKGNGAELDAVEGEENYTANLLKAFDKEAGISNDNPDYLDAQVICRVTEDASSKKTLINYAQISDHTDENGDDIKDIDSDPDNLLPEEWDDENHEDDEDIEKIMLQSFDLSLRKFITSVKGINYTRAPEVDTKPLREGKSTAEYIHSKKPVAVQIGDKVVYTIRVYNEGDINGFANKITDYLPPYLTYVEDSEINKKYNWQILDDENGGRVYTTTYLSSKEFELTAFDSENENSTLDYEDVQIECIVSDDVIVKQNQTNIAEISEYKYNDKIVSTDRDSTADNMVNENDTSSDYLPSDEELPAYKQDELDEKYVPGNEDDDDFEKIYVKQFDLALRKFITKVRETEVTTRIPEVDVTPLKNGEETATYTHPKDALTVHAGDVVIYTLRIYNEGEIAGYASEITDDIPEYLEYLPEDSTNAEYMWKMYDKDGNETENIEEAVSVKTQYLSKQNGEDKLIKAFDGTALDYKDIKIAFKVIDPNSNTYIITNHAQISEDTDENGNPVDDKDSDTSKWNEGEDDQDIENIKVQYFDLSLLKFVSKVIVIEDGKEKITETGYNGHEDPEPVVKVELHKKKLNQVVVKFGYGITITNEGDIPGYATEITDYIPEGLKFDPTDNPEWMDEGNNVISTRQLENTLLQPGESKTIEVIFTWINSPDNLAQKTNTAEISEDKNEYDVPDRDSTPDNKQEGEDDIDIAKVILAISTGRAKTYFTLTLGLLAVIAIGVALIKKFVI